MDIQESYLRTFVDTPQDWSYGFYKRLVAQNPEIAAHFVGSPLLLQAIMLNVGLERLVRYYIEGHEADERYLVAVGNKHYRRNIPADMFPAFTEILLATLREAHGTDWTEDLERQWTEALDKGVETMRRGYSDRPFDAW